MARRVTINNKPLRNLSEQEELFVEAYCGPANFNASEAYKAAGFTGLSAGTGGHEVMHRPHIQKAIRQRLDERKEASWLNENIILMKLWEEATRVDKGSSHAARIQALVFLGKHIGMWQDKIKEPQEKSITYNIVNYTDSHAIPTEKVIESIELNKDEVEKVKDSRPLLGVEITDYAEDDN